MNSIKFTYATDLLIFGIDSKKNKNVRALPKKYFSVLLVKREEEPFNGKWMLPCDYVSSDESSKDAAFRILREKTGLSDVYISELMMSDIPNKDVRGAVISNSYIALIDKSILNEELKENVCWFDIILQEIQSRVIVTLTNGKESISYRVNKNIINIKSEEYDYEVVTQNDLVCNHDKLIVEGIMKIREKVKNTDIVFNLMPKEFTIGELKQVYELLLNKKLINSAFRRVIASKVVVTDKQVKTGGHRPSLLCKYKEK